MKPWQLQQADRAWRRAKTAEKISLEETQGLNAKENSVSLLEPKCFLLTFLFIGPANVRSFCGEVVEFMANFQETLREAAKRKAQPQDFAARQETVVRIRQRVDRQEGHSHATVLTLAAPVADPVMTAVMRLFGSPAEALNRIVLTQRTLRKNLTRTGCPIKAALAILSRT